jgi:streptomycin 6-kinase
MVGKVIDVPGGLAASQEMYNGDAGRAFVADLPRRAAEFLERRRLHIDGPSMYGMCALALPVVRADGTSAVLKLQFLDELRAPSSSSELRRHAAGWPISLPTAYPVIPYRI